MSDHPEKAGISSGENPDQPVTVADTEAATRDAVDVALDAGGEPESVVTAAKGGVSWAVAIPAAVAILAIIGWGLISPDSFANFSNGALSFVVEDFGWLFVLAASSFVFFIVWVGVSKFGHIRLGKDKEKPEFSTISWISMMFAAGMGIGLMFYGVAEPLNYYREGVPGHSTNEVGTSMATTMFHWGLHPWAIYAIVGLAIAYGTFRLGRKQLISSAFIPLIGIRRAEGWQGKFIDALAVFATVFGTAASLGIGVLQISAGLEHTGILSNPGVWVLVGIIVVLGLCFLVSALSGVSKGVQYISNFNMVAAIILALFVLIVGPTVVILNTIPLGAGNYLQTFFEMASRTASSANGTAGEWLSGWTIFYWAWWVSWSPFVGMFIARISRGRTIREFVFTVVLVPTLVSLVWFSIFGGTAIEREQTGNSIWGNGDAEGQLFALFETLPGGVVPSIIAMILLGTFFVTSADSASTVMGTMTQNGRLEASKPVTAFWGVLTALIAIVMLVTGGEDALNNLQTITILAASPFVLIIIGLMFALVKGLSDDPAYLDDKAQRSYALKLARERRIAAANARRQEQKQHRSEHKIQKKQYPVMEGPKVKK